jgi:glycerol-3-phosphate acyltransferase PlsY
VVATVAVAWATSSSEAVLGISGVSCIIVARHAGNIQRLLRRQEK